jgi:hypothetical protein
VGGHDKLTLFELLTSASALLLVLFLFFFGADVWALLVSNPERCVLHTCRQHADARADAAFLGFRRTPRGRRWQSEGVRPQLGNTGEKRTSDHAHRPATLSVSQLDRVFSRGNKAIVTRPWASLPSVLCHRTNKRIF